MGSLLNIGDYFFKFGFLFQNGKMMKPILLCLVVASVFAKPKGSIKLADAAKDTCKDDETLKVVSPGACRFYKEQGWCRDRRSEENMRRDCAKTCGFCAE